jgi:hypothetical protein
LGYEVQGTKCVVQSIAPGTGELTGDPFCITFSNGVCQKCAYRYYLSNKACFQVNPFCKSWVNTTGVCLSCYDGYLLDLNSQCIVYLSQTSQTANSFTNSDVNCLQNANGRCTKCAYRFYLDLNNNNICKAVNDQCK